MGIEINQEQVGDEDGERFDARLRRSIELLTQLVERPGFGAGPPSMGAELELDLVDAEGRQLPINREVLPGVLDERVTLEIDRFNLEINARPSPLAGRPFTDLSKQLTSALAAIDQSGRPHGASVVTIGILPTLRQADLAPTSLTDTPRYRALSKAIRQVRGGPGRLRIEGDESVELVVDDVTLEGANTSFQVHLKAGPGEFGRTYDAAQIASAIVLAVSGNSPFFLGRKLWRETRIALFQQAVDPGSNVEPGSDDAGLAARVSFGRDWVRTSPVAPFAESVARHARLLPQCSDEDLEDAFARGAPRFDELKLHHGTVWTWNRAVYDHHDGGHLRVEMRSLPSGPTVDDMVANAAMAVGLTRALTSQAERLIARLSFDQARRNFYEAARSGLDAKLWWPGENEGPAVLIEARELAQRLLPLALRGLVEAGVDREEAEARIALLGERITSGQTGAEWQRKTVERLEPRLGRDRALGEMLALYRERSAEGLPVSRWALVAEKGA